MTDPAVRSPVTTDAERMQTAVRRAAGLPLPTALAVPRRSPLRSWRPLLGVAITVAFLVVAAQDRTGRSGIDRIPVPEWRSTTGLILIVAAVSGLLLWAAMVLRCGAIARWWSSPLWVLTDRQRRQVQDQLDGEAAVVEEQLPLTRMVARDRLRSAPALWWPVPAAVLFVGGALRVGSGTQWLTAGFYVVLTVAESVRLRQRHRSLRAFLDLHPVPAAATTDP